MQKEHLLGWLAGWQVVGSKEEEVEVGVGSKQSANLIHFTLEADGDGSHSDESRALGPFGCLKFAF